METERAEGILLRRSPVTESSLIVTWYTREFGKLRTMAKGGRRLKGPFVGRLDLFYRDELVFARSRRSDLHLLVDCQVDDAREGLRKGADKVAAASYGCELVDMVTVAEDASEIVFERLDDFLSAVERRVDPVVLVWFELQLLVAAGWASSLRLREAGGVAQRILGSLAIQQVSGAHRVELSREQVKVVRDCLWEMWEEHVGRPPRTREYAWRKFSVDSGG
jgi:DNA repair protein RecO (recombination protein O)